MRVKRWSRQGALLIAVGLGVLGAACTTPEPEGTAIYLVDRFDEASIEGAVATETDLPRIEWTFKDVSEKVEWQALEGLAEMKVADGKLTGRTTGGALLAIPGPTEIDPNDYFHALEIQLRSSAGTRMGVSFDSVLGGGRRGTGGEGSRVGGVSGFASSCWATAPGPVLSRSEPTSKHMSCFLDVTIHSPPQIQRWRLIRCCSQW